MRRTEAISMVAEAAEAEDALLVCNIGYSSRELYSLLDREENFYMLGSMGLASSIGLGLALARPERRVMVIDGDGSVLMNLGTLATIASFAPDNYLLIIMDNCCYGSTGNQPTCTAIKTDLAAVAEGAGVPKVRRASTPQDLFEALQDGSVAVAVVKVEPGNADVPVIDLSPEVILERFTRSALKTRS